MEGLRGIENVSSGITGNERTVHRTKKRMESKREGRRRSHDSLYSQGKEESSLLTLRLEKKRKREGAGVEKKIETRKKI